MIDIIVDPDEEFLEDEAELRRYGRLSGHPANEDYLDREDYSNEEI